MLPYIESQQRLQALLNGICRIRLLGNHQLAILISRQPHPTRAKERRPSLLERLLERLKRPEVAHDGLHDPSFRSRLHRLTFKLLKVHIVIQYLPSVIEDCSLTMEHEFFQRFKFSKTPLALWRGVRG